MVPWPAAGTRSGITGASDDIQESLSKRISNLSDTYHKPIVVGFGLSQVSHVEQVLSSGANGAIVASHFAKIIEDMLDQPQLYQQQILEFIYTVKERI